MKKLKQEFGVEGMSCAACASSVEEAILGVEGVKMAAVNYASNSVWIDFDSHLTSLEKLKRAVEDYGYTLLVERETQEEKDQRQNRSYQNLKTKTVGASILSIPVVLLGMFFDKVVPYSQEISLVLTSVVVFAFGGAFYQNAWKQAKRGSSNMDTLIALGTSIAFSFSVSTTIFPSFWTQNGVTPYVYFEAASVIISFVLLGRLLEEGAKSKTSDSIRILLSNQVTEVIRINQGKEEATDIRFVKIGDEVLVRPGDKIPVDGQLISGDSYVDESMFTGEPLPKHKSIQSKVFAGSINQQGSFILKASAVGGATVLSQIVQRVKEAQGSKAPIQKLVDKIAAVFVPIILIISLLTFVCWFLYSDENAFSFALVNAISVLVIACPCALGLATPTTIKVGMGMGAEHQILIKDASSLEIAQNVDAIVFDKTGTLTTGNMQVIQENWLLDKNEFLPILLALEAKSNHPIATSMLEHFGSDKKGLPAVFNVENRAGKGIKAQVKTETYSVGNAKFIASQVQSLDMELLSKNKNGTQVLFANSTQVIAEFTLADSAKPDAKELIAQLKTKAEIHLLSGDSQEAVEELASKLSLESYHAEQLPQDKQDFISSLQAKGKIVAMVGDGINDSQSLAQADLSIAMGTGTDVAIEVAQITLLSNELRAIQKALLLSQKTSDTIRQNLFWAFFYNLIGIPIAAGVLYPFTGFLLDPMIASAAMAFSSVSVVLNSLRLKFVSL